MTTPAPNSPDAVYRQFGHVPRTVSVPGSGSQQLMTGIGLIIQATLANTNLSTPARYRLLDGTDSTAPTLAILAAPAASGITMSPCPPGIYFGNGIYYHAELGAATVSVTYIPLTDPLR